jgi:hypothetical protein
MGPPIAEGAELAQTTHENVQKVVLESSAVSFLTLPVERARFSANTFAACHLFEFFQIIFGKNLVG